MFLKHQTWPTKPFHCRSLKVNMDDLVGVNLCNLHNNRCCILMKTSCVLTSLWLNIRDQIEHISLVKFPNCSLPAFSSHKIKYSSVANFKFHDCITLTETSISIRKKKKAGDIVRTESDTRFDKNQLKFSVTLVCPLEVWCRHCNSSPVDKTNLHNVTEEWSC